MMVVRFDSEQYSTVNPGKGFSMTVTAEPSGIITILIISLKDVFLKSLYLQFSVLAFGITGDEN